MAAPAQSLDLALDAPELRSELILSPANRPLRLADFVEGLPPEGPAQVAHFRQRSPGDGAPVSLETTAYLAYDRRHLYVVFVCRDDPSQVRARMARREDVASDDRVSLYLDTFRDGQRAYLFAANPLGVQQDGILTEGSEIDYSFDAIWHTEGQLTADGFAVLMTIPFESLRFSGTKQQTWGIALGRSIPRKSEEAFWPHITNRVEGFVPQLAPLRGLRDISPKWRVQLNPYSVAAAARVLDASEAAFVRAGEVRAGLDAKAVVNDAFTLDLALNPDFSQVESDEPQVTVNERFEVTFPEKRPFFMENAGYFETPIPIFFSRRIADPQLGARLTGQAGRWAIGALVSNDREPRDALRPPDAEGRPRGMIGIARVQRTVGGSATVGVLATRLGVASNTEAVLALDTRFKLGPNWVFTGQFGRIQTRHRDAGGTAGLGLLAELAYEGRHLGYSGRYQNLEAAFDPALGKVRREGIYLTEHQAEYSWRPDNSPLTRFGPGVEASVGWRDADGRLKEWEIEGEFEVELVGETVMDAEYEESFERYKDLDFRMHNLSLLFETEYLRWLSVSARIVRGTDLFRDQAEGLDPFVGAATEVELALTVRPVPSLRLDQSYVQERISTRRGASPPGIAPGTTAFAARAFRTRLNYQFTRALSLRAIVDVTSLEPGAGLADFERERRINTDLLLTYLVRPGTGLFVGFTEGYENLVIDREEGRSSIVRSQAGLRSSGRQFFVKVSYLLR